MTSAAENTGGQSVIDGKLLKGALGLVFTAPCEQRAASPRVRRRGRVGCGHPALWMLQLPFAGAANAKGGCGRPLPGAAGAGQHEAHRRQAGAGGRAERAGPRHRPPVGGPLRSARAAAGLGERGAGTGRRRREPGEAGTHTHTAGIAPPSRVHAGVTRFESIRGFFQRCSAARGAAHPRRGSLFPAGPCSPGGWGRGSGESGRCRPAGMGVPLGSLGKSLGAGVCLWRGWFGGDRRCPSVLLRAWAGGTPGRVFALDPLPGGARMQFWGVKSPVNMTKEDIRGDGAVPGRQACWM